MCPTRSSSATVASAWDNVWSSLRMLLCELGPLPPTRAVSYSSVGSLTALGQQLRVARNARLIRKDIGVNDRCNASITRAVENPPLTLWSRLISSLGTPHLAGQ